MRLSRNSPNLFARIGIYGIDVSLHVPKIYGVLHSALSFDRSNADGVPHRAFGLIRPMNASGRHIERIDVADVGTHKHAAGDDRGLPPRRHAVWITESPFEFEVGNLIRSDPSRFGRLVARVDRVDSP